MPLKPEDLAAELAATAEFEPTQAQSSAKVRLERKLAESKGLYQLDRLTPELFVRLSGTRKILTWLDDPEFVAWLHDQDSVGTYLRTRQRLAAQKLVAIIDSELGDPKEGFVTARDQLAAVDMLNKLLGSFPSRAKVVFADRDLNDLSDDEVAAQITAARAKLGEGN